MRLAITLIALTCIGEGASANIGVNIVNPASGLDVFTTGTASAIVVPRDSTANRPTTPLNGMLRYNTSASALEAYVNGAWVQIAVQPLGSTNNVVASGPPVNANVYSYTATANFTPVYGSVSNINNGIWPASGTNTYRNANCVQIRDQGISPTQYITLDLGAVKTIGNLYTYQTNGYSFILGATFSVDGVSYTNSIAYNIGGSDALAAIALSPSVSARYIRLMNSYPMGGDNNYEMLCQFAPGP